ncbi:MAG TPA: hypothetical protein VJS66_09545, partial [Burkholderiales bacterium]|nr:hypothetical protein [Burkholderiales bacterium]
ARRYIPVLLASTRIHARAFQALQRFGDFLRALRTGPNVKKDNAISCASATKLWSRPLKKSSLNPIQNIVKTDMPDGGRN